MSPNNQPATPKGGEPHDLPDLNPIEQIFSKLQQLIRSAKPRKLMQIVNAVAKALGEITLDHIQAVFDHG